MMDTSAEQVSAPVGSDDQPVIVLLTDSDITDSACDACRAAADDWPRSASFHPCSVPGVMFRGALYCTRCAPVAYDPATGYRACAYCGILPGRTHVAGIGCPSEE